MSSPVNGREFSKKQARHSVEWECLLNTGQHTRMNCLSLSAQVLLFYARAHQQCMLEWETKHAVRDRHVYRCAACTVCHHQKQLPSLNKIALVEYSRGKFTGQYRRKAGFITVSHTHTFSRLSPRKGGMLIVTIVTVVSRKYRKRGAAHAPLTMPA